MTGAHDHGHVHARAGARHQGRLAVAFALVAVVLVAEVAGGLLTGSLALLSDAAHMLTDTLGLGMALAAIHLASRAASGDHGGRAGPAAQRTFGLYRLEILAALANAVLLLAASGWILWQALRRFGDPHDVATGGMLAVAAMGLAVNVVSFFLLREGARESLNVRGAYLEVVADAVGSVGVVGGAVVIGATGWQWVDPLVAVAIAVWVVPRTVRLGGQALRILVQAAPPELDLGAVRRDLAGVRGVVDVHDLHVWTLTSDMEVATAHLMVTPDTDTHAVLDEARDRLRRWNVVHATLQVEPSDHRGCAEVSW